MILYVPGSDHLLILGMAIPPFNRNLYIGYLNPFYWVHDHPPYQREAVRVWTLAHMTFKKINARADINLLLVPLPEGQNRWHRYQKVD